MGSAYVLVVMMFVLGAAIEGPIVQRIVHAVAADGDGPASENTGRLLADPRGQMAIMVSAALYVAVIFVMVFKPFS